MAFSCIFDTTSGKVGGSGAYTAQRLSMNRPESEEKKEVHSREDDVQKNFLFIGNPGTGKSTLINSFTQQKLCLSGVCLGGGLTKMLKENPWEAPDGEIIRFMDTPGLDDEILRKKAAEEITKALKKNGNYKLFFVVITSSGRVRPSDKVTMQLVLNACPKLKEFGIIINKCTKGMFRAMKNKPKEKENFEAILLSGLPPSKAHIHYIGVNPDADDEENYIMTLTKETRRFITDGFKGIDVVAEEVESVKADQYEELRNNFEAQISSLMKENETLLKAIEQLKVNAKIAEKAIAESREESKAAKKVVAEEVESVKVVAEEVESVKADQYEELRNNFEAQFSSLKRELFLGIIIKEVERLKVVVEKTKKDYENAIKDLEKAREKEAREAIKERQQNAEKAKKAAQEAREALQAFEAKASQELARIKSRKFFYFTNIFEILQEPTLYWINEITFDRNKRAYKLKWKQSYINGYYEQAGGQSRWIDNRIQAPTCSETTLGVGLGYGYAYGYCYPNETGMYNCNHDKCETQRPLWRL